MANRATRSRVVSDVAALTGYHRTSVIRLLRGPAQPEGLMAAVGGDRRRILGAQDERSGFGRLS